MVNLFIETWFKVYSSFQANYTGSFGTFLYLLGTALLLYAVMNKVVEAYRITVQGVTNSFAGTPYNNVSCGYNKEDEGEDNDSEDAVRNKDLLSKERELVSIWNEIGDALRDTPGWPKREMPFVHKCIFAIADLKDKAGVYAKKPKPKNS